MLRPSTKSHRTFSNVTALVILGFGFWLLFRRLHFSPQCLGNDKVSLAEIFSRDELFPSQKDSRLVKFVRENYILGPNDADYNLTIGEGNPDKSEGQVDAIRGLFKNETHGHGFFIECGANDGEFLSNTLWFEKVLGWNGLLIEADPDTFARLRAKNRKASHANVCLSPMPYPSKLNFYRSVGGNGGRNGLNKREEVNRRLIVDCMPLYTLLAAMEQYEVDVFSLDIEGAEFDVLKTIPFELVNISVFIIEHWGLSRPQLKAFLNSKGYKLFHVLDTPLSQDSIYVQAKLLPAEFQELKL